MVVLGFLRGDCSTPYGTKNRVNAQSELALMTAYCTERLLLASLRYAYKCKERMGVEDFNEQRMKRCMLQEVTHSEYKDVDSTCPSSISSDGEREESKPLPAVQGP